MTSELDSESGLGEPRQDGTVRPGTFRGLFANCALALIRIAAALERIANAIEQRDQS